ncbi:MAG TPA: hypothetical protein VGC42_21455, partial [Kofleriaceae bacterium]
MTDDPALEWKLRALALPGAIALAFAFHAWPTGHFLQRTFLSMMVHELGHAVTAWWCGFAALPSVWKTLIPETRSVVIPLAVLGLELWMIVRGWRTQRLALASAGLGLAIVQAIALSASIDRAQEAITFGGDAGAMVLGSLLVLSFFAGPDSRLRTQQLRWGFLVIGAAALVDTFGTWSAARRDPDTIPFGEIEGVGLSDPSKLDEVYQWTTHQIVHRYYALGLACFAVLAAAWLYFTLTAR